VCTRFSTFLNCSSVSYKGIESAAIHNSRVLINKLFYSYSSSFLDTYYFNYTTCFWKLVKVMVIFSVLFPRLSNIATQSELNWRKSHGVYKRGIMSRCWEREKMIRNRTEIKSKRGWNMEH